MRLEAVPAPLRYVCVALLFAICGASAAQFLAGDFPGHFPVILPAPFAILCALLFWRSSRSILAVLLMFFVWPIAFWITYYSGFFTGDVLSPLCVGGFIGGLGLALCLSICNARLFSLKYLFGGGVIGCLSAMSFVPWLRLFYAHNNSGLSEHQPTLLFAFAIWQAAVGTYLYAICAATTKNAKLEGCGCTSVGT